MKELNSLMQEIIQLTSEIESKYPELHKYFNETPMKLCDTENKEVCLDDLKLYLETLKAQLKHHISTHNGK